MPEDRCYAHNSDTVLTVPLAVHGRSRRLAAIVVLAGIAGISAACGRSGPSDEATSPAGSTPGSPSLVVAYRSAPASFNRYVSPQAAEELLARLTHATLVRLNRVTGEIEPRLAREWTTSADGLTWTLKLREGITFSDGAPFSSADVLFSFRAVYDERVGSALASSLSVGGKPFRVRAVDPHTVEVTLPSAYAPGIGLLDALPILPEHKLKAALDDGTFATAWSLDTPPSDVVGLGPFVLESYTPGQRLTLARNARFWKTDAAGRPLPYLDRIEIQIVPDQNAEVLRLESGGVDLITDQVRSEDLAALRDLERKGALTLVEAGVSVTPDMLWFNLKPGAAPAKDRPWLQRDEFRRAISHAIDRQAFVDTVFLGAAVPIFGPITPGHGEWYLADLPRTDLDPARTKALLAEVGLLDRNGDNLVDDARGRTASFSILTQKGHTIRERSTALIAENLRKAGLEAHVVPVDRGDMIDRWSSGDYDAIYFSVLADSFDPGRQLDFWLSSGSFHFWNAGQPKPATRWEAQVDALMHKQVTSLDRAERRRLFADAQRVFAEHQPVLYFAAPRVIVATSRRVTGATPSVLSPQILWNAEVLALAPAAGASRK